MHTLTEFVQEHFFDTCLAASDDIDEASGCVKVITACVRRIFSLFDNATFCAEGVFRAVAATNLIYSVRIFYDVRDATAAMRSCSSPSLLFCKCIKVLTASARIGKGLVAIGAIAKERMYWTPPVSALSLHSKCISLANACDAWSDAYTLCKERKAFDMRLRALRSVLGGKPCSETERQQAEAQFQGLSASLSLFSIGIKVGVSFVGLLPVPNAKLPCACISLLGTVASCANFFFKGRCTVRAA